jgi:hypothetical protein
MVRVMTGLWKEFEKKLIVVDGKVMNRETVTKSYEADAKAIADAVEDAKRRGKWAAAARGGPAAAEAFRPALANWARTSSPEDDQANAGTAARLKRKIDKVDFNGQALSDVIDFIRDATGLDVLVEWRALEEAGIPKDAPITLQLREPATIEAVLTLMFRTMGGVLRYEIDKGVVVVTMADRVSQQVTRVYDVADLLGGGGLTGGAAAGHEHDPRAAGDPGATAVPGAGGGGGGGMGLGGTVETSQLIGLITSTIHPSEWTTAGGNNASIATFKNKLVIKAPEPIHKEVAELLEMLREKPPAAAGSTKATSTEKPH